MVGITPTPGAEPEGGVGRCVEVELGEDGTTVISLGVIDVGEIPLMPDSAVAAGTVIGAETDSLPPHASSRTKLMEPAISRVLISSTAYLPLGWINTRVVPSLSLRWVIRWCPAFSAHTITS